MKNDKKFDLMIKNNFDLMKKWISISWNLTSWSFPLLVIKAFFCQMNFRFGMIDTTDVKLNDQHQIDWKMAVC
jgi:hypothetical protein